MNIPDEFALYLPYLPLAANAVMLFAVGLAICAFRRQVRRLGAFQQAAQERTKVHDVAERRGQFRLGLRIERRLCRIEAELQKLGDMQSSEPRLGERQLPIDHAIHMARGGASIDELTRTCGLSLGEARLTHKLHGGLAATAKLQ